MKLRPSFDNGMNRKRSARPPRRRRKRLRSIAMLPALLTLGNLFFGFMALYCCGREMRDLGAGLDPATLLTLKSTRWESIVPTYLAIGVFMLIGAMICDALDGRIARITDRASRFGEQLDSLADTVSFGVAPAFLMLTLVLRELEQWGRPPFGFTRFGQAAVLIGALYACCAVLRLARFTVEASLEEAAHTGFKGLPSPGAAAAVMSLVLLHEHLDVPGIWASFANFITVILPFCTLAVALLMVSRIPYVHAVSAFLRRRPFGHVVITLLVVPWVILFPSQMALLVAWGFVLSGPVNRFLRKKGRTSPGGNETAGSPIAEQESPALLGDLQQHQQRVP